MKEEIKKNIIKITKSNENLEEKLNFILQKYYNRRISFQTYLNTKNKLIQMLIEDQFPTVDEWNIIARNQCYYSSISIKYIEECEWKKLEKKLKQELREELKNIIGEKKKQLDKIKKANTQYIGKKIKYYEEIGSTHIEAKKIAQKETNGTILIAESQTNGIGTKGRNWYTGIGKNIAMTIILKPTCKIESLDGFTVKIAEIMKRAIKELYGYELEIKEPNDLLLNKKKICGILTQIGTSGEKIKYLIISLGFNVNEDKFSEETNKIATSLKNEYKKEFEREKIIIKFIEKLEKELEKLL